MIEIKKTAKIMLRNLRLRYKHRIFIGKNSLLKVILRTRVCATCRINRPPLASHCSQCDKLCHLIRSVSKLTQY